MFKNESEIIVQPAEVHQPETAGSPVTILVRLTQGDAEERLFFRYHGATPTPQRLLDSLVPLVLVPAMKLGSPLRFAGPLSAEILSGAERFQEIFSVWYPQFKKVPLRATSIEPVQVTENSRGAAVFFSGGLDSSYSLIKHQQELTHAIFVHGCDIPLENVEYRNTTTTRLKETAAAHGVKLVEIETDLLRFSSQYCDWGLHYHGAALAAMAHLMHASIGKVFVASSTTYSRIIPWGSSVVTDPLWSTKQIKIIYDGAERSRIGKIPIVAQSPLAIRNLRVCFGTPKGGYNCGQCEKCYRTMVALRICGALDNRAFDTQLDLEAMQQNPEVISKFFALQSWHINRETALAMGTDRPLVEALNRLHQQTSYLQLVQRLSADKADIIQANAWRQNLPKFRNALFKSLRDTDPEWWKEKILTLLPTIRNAALETLANHDRPWFKRLLWKIKWQRLRSKFGLGKSK